MRFVFLIVVSMAVLPAAAGQDLPEFAEPNANVQRPEPRSQQGPDCEKSNACVCRPECPGNPPPENVPISGLWALVLAGGGYGAYSLSRDD